MKKRIHIGLLFLLLPCFLSVYGCSQKKAMPRARKGVLDLRAWDFKRYGLVELKGEWEIYWHKLLTPEDFNGSRLPLKTGFTKVPSYWEGQHVNGTRLHYQGYATLRLLIFMPSDPPPVVIDYFRVAGSRNIWLNGHLLGGNRIPDLPRDGDRNPSSTAVTHYVTTPGRIQELIIQLGNSDMNVAYGAHFSIVFGPLKTIQHHRLIRTGIDFFTISACILIGFYHLVLFFFRTNERTLLYFSCVCLLFGIVVLFTGASRAFWLYTAFPHLTWPVYLRVGYTVYFLAILSCLLFIHSLFPRESSPTIVRIGMTLCGFWVVAGLILSFSGGVPYLQALMRLLFYPTVRPSEISAIILAIYIIGVIFLAARRKRPGAYILAAGMLIFIFVFAFDILMLLINPGVIRLAGIGFIALLISQALMLAKQFSQSFSDVARLSETLKEKNIALSRLDRMKDEFLANTSHELRTPLHGIIGMTEAVMAGAAGTIPGKAAANLSIVHASAKRLSGLINDLLDFSRLKNREIKLKRQALDIQALIDAVLAVIQNLARHKPIQFIKQIPSDIPMVDGDENRLQQILYNLIGNAVKFTERGHITIGAKARDGAVEVWVKDTGIGIPEDRFETIFQAFEQIDTAPTRTFEGTGLGLSITRDLVKLHGGDIGVQSTPGQGATFTFSLPASDQTPAASAGRTELLPAADGGELTVMAIESLPMGAGPLPGLDQTGGACQVLIVDDDLVNLQVVASHLSLENISFNIAADGPAAIGLIEADGPPDVILLDIMMPKMTGYQVSRTLRTTYSPSELPIIMLTAKNRMADLVAGFEAGANDYLTKPFSKDELLVRVRSQLKLKKAYQTLAENVRLKKELAQRRQTELDLRLMQRRLSQLLDTVEDMVITVNESREIAFCNATANSLLGFEIETLLGQSLRLLFDDSFSETLARLLKGQLQQEADAAMVRSYPQVNITAADGSQLKVHIIATPLNLDEERLQALIIRHPESPRAATVGAPSQTALVVIDELNRHQERLHGLEETLSGLLPRLAAQAPEVLGEIRALDQALAAVERNLLSDDAAVDRRQLAVMVMQLSLDYWYEATGLDKAELARESGIWKVYTNQDGWTRTQTLDKYLHSDTLPRRPRWKLIHNTAVYVLAACMTPSPLRDRLEQALARLRLAGRSKE